jgi:hypothetical protein
MIMNDVIALKQRVDRRKKDVRDRLNMLPPDCRYGDHMTPIPHVFLARIRVWTHVDRHVMTVFRDSRSKLFNMTLNTSPERHGRGNPLASDHCYTHALICRMISASIVPLYMTR